LPGYDHELYALESNANAKFKDQLLTEFVAVHRATIMFFNQLSNEALKRKGQASGEELSVEMMAHIIAGHTQHHLSVIEEKYIPKL
jgi:ABC-type Zn uptake system ZnuABC Zn-binding protein ZnuA